MKDTFAALRVHRTDGKNQAKLENLTNDDLPPGNVLVGIHYSTINYKDALAVTGKAPIIREYPRIAGIDLSGEVLESEDERFKPGQQVASLVNGLGETRDGGYAERTRINADNIQLLPNNMSTRTAMGLGTAGVTAALAIYRMEQNGQHPGLGPILVTGATGGVGSIAIDLLSNRGYETVALSGKPEQSPFLKSLGASSVIDRQELELESRPLGRASWGGAIDNLGGDILSWLTRTTRPRGNIASIGLAASTDLQTTVLPFILRGVTLIGISLEAHIDLLEVMWEQLANDMAPRNLDAIITQEVTLQEVHKCFDAYIDGAVTGRTLVKIR